MLGCLEVYGGVKSLIEEGMVVEWSWVCEDMWVGFVLLDSCC